VARLKRIEKETVILFNEEEPYVLIETFNNQLKKRLNEMCKKQPQSYTKLSEDKKNGSADYQVAISCFSVSLRDETSPNFPK
jgi:flagellar motor switch protein FliM